MNLPSSDLQLQGFAKIVTAIFLIGWGLGGIMIGAMGDRYGRVRMLTLSILIYALGTGLTALTRTPEQFIVLRAFAGFGIGGVFGLGVALIAENFEGQARVMALAGFQLLSTIGNITSALTKMGVDQLAANGTIATDSVWRILFGIGTLPIIFAIASILWLKESETWLALKAENKLPASPIAAYRALVASKAERRNLLTGTLLSLAGVVGLWAIGEYAVDLQDAVFATHFKSLGLVGDAVKQSVASAKNWAYLLQMCGGAIGMVGFSWLTNRYGRRPVFLLFFAGELVTTLYIYANLSTPAQAYWMLPVMGFFQLGIFAGFSIYLPELFGAAVRGTGVSFCYNLGRFAAAGGSFASALLTTKVYAAYPAPDPLRYAAMTMCAVFVIGLVAAWYAPETKGRDLPD